MVESGVQGDGYRMNLAPELMLSIDMRRVGDDGGLIYVFVFMGLHKPITQTGLNAYGCGDGHVQIVTRTYCRVLVANGRFRSTQGSSAVQIFPAALSYKGDTVDVE
uniref:Uncharacterized protein n=1 Tax=Magallana gigas TaxID=29159 RepID=K1QIM7_MAGGI